MKIVIQCASKKTTDAEHLVDDDGARVLFVADPRSAPPCRGKRYARPDDIATDGKSWREFLCNNSKNNPLGLSLAYKLYHNGTYQMLVERYGLHNVFILSAGWGLIAADFPTPNYDITFRASAEPYKRRRKRDRYNDLCMLPADADDDLVFFGGKDYQPLFHHLTKNYRGKRVVFYNSAATPKMPGCALHKYPTTTRTNWHYGCAVDFANNPYNYIGATTLKPQ